MNDRDYAILVGIKRYPGLDDKSNRLDAPVRDARAVREWLVDANGGGIPDDDDHVKEITTSGKPKPVWSEEPNVSTIAAPFKEFLHRAEQGGRDREGYFGRRLYIYMAGHGRAFGNTADEGTILAADAFGAVVSNFPVTSWWDGCVKQGLFREYVLWLDFCMQCSTSLAPAWSEIEGTISPMPISRVFLSFACPRSNITVERPIAQDENRKHGVFSWALLQGLKGAARTPDGAITGESLHDFLVNAMGDYLTPSDREVGQIASEPHIPQQGPMIVFSPPAGRPGSVAAPLPTYPVSLNLPAHPENAEVRIWSGSPPVAKSYKAKRRLVKAPLLRGLHVAEIPALKLRQGFQVTGSGPVTVDVNDHGDAVRKASSRQTFSLTVDAGPETTEIVVVNEQFGGYAAVPGNYLSQANVPFGIYKIKAKVSSRLNYRIVLLDRNEPNLELKAPAVPSAAPLAETAFTHKYQEDAIMRLSQKTPDVKAGKGAQIFLVARVWTSNGGSPKSEPWSGIELLNAAGRVIADLGREGDHTSGRDPLASCLIAVNPGTYYLRETLPDGRQIEQTLIAVRDWRLEAYVLRPDSSRVKGKGSPKTDAGSGPGRTVSILMNRIGDERDASVERQLETARLALSEGREILNDHLIQLLVYNTKNPIASLLGAHLLLSEARDEEGRTPGLDELRRILSNLRKLVGHNHPDVEAISLKCPDPKLHTKHPLRAPPMFSEGWNIAVEASQARPSLIPLALARRVTAINELAPYLVWFSDEETQKAYRDHLISWRDALIGQSMREAMIGQAVKRALIAGTIRPVRVGRPGAMIPYIHSAMALQAQTRGQLLALNALAYGGAADYVEAPSAALGAMVGEPRPLLTTRHIGELGYDIHVPPDEAEDLTFNVPATPASPTRRARSQAAQMNIPPALLRDIWKA